MGTLVLLRHGQSVWNAENLFTGWVDVPLSETGEQEARRGGELLKEHGLLPDVVHTSVLRRAIRTSEIALNAADRLLAPLLAERYVDPAGEQVLRVPLALTVAEQDQRVDGRVAHGHRS